MSVPPFLPPQFPFLFEILVGQDWPQADEDALRDCAQAWTDAMTGLLDITDTGAHAASRVQASVQATSSDAFKAYWDKIVGGDESAYGQLARQCETLAEQFLAFAEQTEATKIQIDIQIVILAIQLAYDFLIAPLTGGLSMTEAPLAMFAGRMFIRELLANILQSVLLAVIPDLITQSIMIAEGHQSGWDTGKLLADVGNGVVGGVVGAVGGKLLGMTKLDQGLEGVLGDKLGKLAFSAASGAIVNVATTAATTVVDEAATGQPIDVSAQSLMSAALTGGATGALFHVVHSAAERPTTSFALEDGSQYTGIPANTEGKFNLFDGDGKFVGTGNLDDAGKLTVNRFGDDPQTLGVGTQTETTHGTSQTYVYDENGDRQLAHSTTVADGKPVTAPDGTTWTPPKGSTVHVDAQNNVIGVSTEGKQPTYYGAGGAKISDGEFKSLITGSETAAKTAAPQASAPATTTTSAPATPTTTPTSSATTPTTTATETPAPAPTEFKSLGLGGGQLSDYSGSDEKGAVSRPAEHSADQHVNRSLVTADETRALQEPGQIVQAVQSSSVPRAEQDPAAKTATSARGSASQSSDDQATPLTGPLFSAADMQRIDAALTFAEKAQSRHAELLFQEHRNLLEAADPRLTPGQREAAATAAQLAHEKRVGWDELAALSAKSPDIDTQKTARQMLENAGVAPKAEAVLGAMKLRLYAGSDDPVEVEKQFEQPSPHDRAAAIKQLLEDCADRRSEVELAMQQGNGWLFKDPAERVGLLAGEIRGIDPDFWAQHTTPAPREPELPSSFRDRLDLVRNDLDRSGLGEVIAERELTTVTYEHPRMPKQAVDLFKLLVGAETTQHTTGGKELTIRERGTGVEYKVVLRETKVSDHFGFGLAESLTGLGSPFGEPGVWGGHGDPGFTHNLLGFKITAGVHVDDGTKVNLPSGQIGPETTTTTLTVTPRGPGVSGSGDPRGPHTAVYSTVEQTEAPASTLLSTEPKNSVTAYVSAETMLGPAKLTLKVAVQHDGGSSDYAKALTTEMQQARSLSELLNTITHSESGGGVSVTASLGLDVAGLPVGPSLGYKAEGGRIDELVAKVEELTGGAKKILGVAPKHGFLEQEPDPKLVVDSDKPAEPHHPAHPQNDIFKGLHPQLATLEHAPEPPQTPEIRFHRAANGTLTLLGGSDAPEVVARAEGMKTVPGTLNLVAHATKDGFVIDGKVVPFAEVYNQIPEEYRGDGPIRLIACEAGAGDGAAAQALAEATGRPVLAANSVVWITEDGKVVAANPVNRDTNWYPTRPPDGVWKVYTPGAEPREVGENDPLHPEVPDGWHHGETSTPGEHTHLDVEALGGKRRVVAPEDEPEERPEEKKMKRWGYVLPDERPNPEKYDWAMLAGAQWRGLGETDAPNASFHNVLRDNLVNRYEAFRASNADVVAADRAAHLGSEACPRPVRGIMEEVSGLREGRFRGTEYVTLAGIKVKVTFGKELPLARIDIYDLAGQDAHAYNAISPVLDKMTDALREAHWPDPSRQLASALKDLVGTAGSEAQRRQAIEEVADVISAGRPPAEAALVKDRVLSFAAGVAYLVGHLEPARELGGLTNLAALDLAAAGELSVKDAVSYFNVLHEVGAAKITRAIEAIPADADREAAVSALLQMKQGKRNYDFFYSGYGQDAIARELGVTNYKDALNHVSGPQAELILKYAGETYEHALRRDPNSELHAREGILAALSEALKSKVAAEGDPGVIGKDFEVSRLAASNQELAREFNDLPTALKENYLLRAAAGKLLEHIDEYDLRQRMVMSRLLISAFGPGAVVTGEHGSVTPNATVGELVDLMFDRYRTSSNASGNSDS